MRPFIVLALKLVPGVVRAERHGKMVNSGALHCIVEPRCDGDGDGDGDAGWKEGTTS